MELAPQTSPKKSNASIVDLWVKLIEVSKHEWEDNKWDLSDQGWSQKYIQVHIPKFFLKIKRIT